MFSDTEYLLLGTATGGEYRRKNCRLPDDSEAGNCTTSSGITENGVDPNRNYGGLWGGPGAEPSNPLLQTYRGPGPFSEPETRNIRALISNNQVMSLITNHTTAGLVLRAPGIALLGDPIDEERGYRALGDDMAKHNGYFSQNGFELYDTTGTTEDWSYNATGGFGFTFEIYCGEPNYETGDCDDPAFHPRYETMVKEWTGESDQANHVGDPDGEFDGQGNHEAYYIAAESALNEQRHSVLEGNAPAGATLRLTKQFKTETFPQEQEDGSEKPIRFDDKLETVYDVGSNGTFRWHVNPSTRPIVAKETGVRGAGEPSPPETQTGGLGGSSTTEDNPDDGAAIPTGDANSNDTVSYNDHPITIPSDGDNAIMDVRVSWTSLASDWDIKLYEDRNGDGKSQNDEPVVSTSQTGPSNIEELSASQNPRLPAGKKYVLRVNNFAATEQYDVEITFEAPLPFKPAQVESYTLTCERGGRVFDTQQVQIDRGQAKQLDLSACARAIATADGGGGGGTGTGGGAGGPGSGGPGSGGPGGGGQTACVAGRGFRSASLRPRGRKVDLLFTRRDEQPVQVDVFQQSRGRKVIGNRLVARFRNRTESFRWNGKANRRGRKVTNGYYFVRYRMITSAGGREVRRQTLERKRGRFVRRRGFYRRTTCDALPSFKLGAPVFGGRQANPLRIAFRVFRRSRVQVTVLRGLRGDRVVKRFKTRSYRRARTHRLRMSSAGLRRGNYRVRVVVRRPGSNRQRGGGRLLTSTLVSRRL